jgi:ribosomal protein L11 methyltransferase
MWMERFTPFRIGRRFLIVPPWQRDTKPGRISIAIQPGRAFGTGHHPTTAGALRAIDRLIRAEPPRSMLDVGTGSGILAIAMAMLGTRDITALDIEPIALDNARENARLNHVEQFIRFSAVPISSIRRHFELVTANIQSDALIRLQPVLTRATAPRGHLILGGILSREADAVERVYRPALRRVSRSTNRGWTTLVLARPTNRQ